LFIYRVWLTEGLSYQYIFVPYNKGSLGNIIIDNIIVNVPYGTYIL